MHLHARKVLQDCKKAWQWLDEETDQDRYRRAWVCALALLRSVGHVLDKVDAKRNNRIKTAADGLYRSWKSNRAENAIFWDFIEEERNLILKEYELRYEDSPTVLVSSDKSESAFRLEGNLFCPLIDGAFAGEDGRDVVERAISWWEKQLVSLEDRLSNE
jgi:hypothetical protein